MEPAPPIAARATRCAHGDRCGGCALLHLGPEEQLAHKRARLAAAIAPYAVIADVAVDPARGAHPVVRYRTRLKWMAGPGGVLGLFARGSHEVVDTPGCAVAAPGLVLVAEALRALLRAPEHARIAASLRAVDLRAVDASERAACEADAHPREPRSIERVVPDGARALVTLVLVREERPPRRDLLAFARALGAARPEVAGVAANWVAKRSIQVLGPETEIVAGDGTALDRQGDVLVTAAPGAFVQAHRGQAAAMARELAACAAALSTEGAPARALELFAGAAPFGLALARAGLDVTSVEAFGPAVQGALAAARHQGLALRAIAGDAEAEAERLARAGERFDLIVVDPPRRGLSPRLRRAIAALAPRAFAYVSCDPDTLARDLADLAWRGLAAARVTPWDFVPQTDHVEALAWLAPRTPPSPRVLARAADGALVVDAPPHVELGVLAARTAAAAAGGVPSGFVAAPPLPPGASGALLLSPASSGARPPPGPFTVLAAVRGVPRGRLPGGERIDRHATSPGRSLVTITVTDPGDVPRLVARLARAGHPVLGDPRDGPTARHVAEKHGVDRPLLHVSALEVPGVGRVEAPIAPDFAAAIARLGLG
jgi:23S rRNA (uracil1939-C5)-methyltransferase